MKSKIIYWVLLIIIILSFTAAQLPTTKPIANKTKQSTVKTNKITLTTDDAITKISSWLKNHKFNIHVSYDEPYDDTINGKKYYCFDMHNDDSENGDLMTEICVDKNTGALVSYEGYSTKPTSLDNWYKTFGLRYKKSYPNRVMSADGKKLSVGNFVYAKQGILGISVNFVGGKIISINNNLVNVAWDTYFENRLIKYDKDPIYESGNAFNKTYYYHSNASDEYVEIIDLHFKLPANKLYITRP